MNWFYAIITFLAFLELVRIRQSFKSIADSYAVWAANTILSIDVDKLSTSIDTVTALTDKLVEPKNLS